MSLGSNLNGLARKAGWEVRRYRPTRSEHARRQWVLREYGVDLVLDVGGNVGEWGALLRRSGYRGRIVSFEPISEAFEALERRAAGDPAWDVHRMALGERDREAAIQVSENLGSSSFLPIEDRHLEADATSAYVREETVPVRKLDSVADDLTSGENLVYLKLDVQGFETKVLAGAALYLSRVIAIQAEVSLVPLYQDEPSPWDVLTRIQSLGFEPFSLDPCFSDPDSGRMLQMDALFVRPRTDQEHVLPT